MTQQTQNLRFEFLNACFYHSFYVSHSSAAAAAAASSSSSTITGSMSSSPYYPQTVYTLASLWTLEDDAIRYLHIRTLLIFQDPEHLIEEMIPQVSKPSDCDIMLTHFLSFCNGQ